MIDVGAQHAAPLRLQRGGAPGRAVGSLSALHEITEAEVHRSCLFFSVDHGVGKCQGEGRGEKEIPAVLHLEVQVWLGAMAGMPAEPDTLSPAAPDLQLAARCSPVPSVPGGCIPPLHA